MSRQIKLVVHTDTKRVRPNKGNAKRKIFCENRNYLGETLRDIRKAKKLTQAEAAKLLDIAQNQWSSYEVGRTKPSVDVIILIAEKFDISPLDLFHKTLDKLEYFKKLPTNKETKKKSKSKDSI